MTSPDPALPESSPPPPPPDRQWLSPALRSSLVSALSLFAFTLVFTSIMAFTHEMTRERIRAAIEQQQMLLIDEVLPGLPYDNALLADVIEVGNSGKSRIGRVWRARHGNTPVALVFETFAPDGYGGRINLVVSLDNAGHIGGVRVASHQETPGLGDYIEPTKDPKKDNLWINQFKKADAAAPASHWEIKKDGGGFDYRAGATVSARAVTRAVGRAVAWVNTHREVLFEAPTGTRFDAERKE